jgi:hypothetical protein
MPVHVARIAAELAADLECKAKLLRMIVDGWDDRGRWDEVLRALDSAAHVLRNPVRLPDALARRLDDTDANEPALAPRSGLTDADRARRMDLYERLRARRDRRALAARLRRLRFRRRWRRR